MEAGGLELAVGFLNTESPPLNILAIITVKEDGFVRIKDLLDLLASLELILLLEDLE